MPKMIDIGRKQEQPATVGESPKKSKISYPSLSLVGDAIPDELKTAENEAMCRLEIVARKIGDSIDTYAENEPRRIEIEVQKMGYIGKGGKLTKDEYLSKNEDEREEYDKRDRGIDEEE